MKTQNIIYLFFFHLIIFSESYAQSTYLPPVNAGDTLNTLVDERFDNNNYAWPVGSNSDGQFQFINNGQYEKKYSIFNPKEDRAIIALNKGVPLRATTNFIIRAAFNLWKTQSEGSGYCGGGFAWAADVPFQNMQLVYFSYNKSSYKFAEWNEAGEYKLLFEKEVPVKINDIVLEIHKTNNKLSFYAATADSLFFLFTTTTSSVVPFNKMGFYIDGKIHLTANRLLVKEAYTSEEKMVASQKRAADFLLWEEKSQKAAKELEKWGRKKEIDYKDKVKVNSVKNELGKVYFQMATIKSIDNELQTAIDFYSLSSELGNELAGKYLGKIYEEKYKQTQLPQDREMALYFYLKSAKLERTDLGFPQALKSYYNLKYPFITDYTYISPYWQNENMLPKTKEAYKKYEEDRIAYAKKSKELAEKFARRPFILIKSVVIDNYASDPDKSYVTTTSTQYPKVILQKIPFEALKYGDYYYDVSERDFIPFTMSYDEVSKMKNRFAMVIRFEDYNINFNFTEHPGCTVCFGEGFVKTSSGAYTYRIATGRYTETRSETIVGQTEAVTRTPVYETHTVQAGPPKYEICKTCNGTGGIKREKNIQIMVDGIRVK